MTGVDFHQHVWPDAFRRALEARHEPPFLRGRRLVLPRGGEFVVEPAAYAPETRLAELDRAGLDQAVVSLPPTLEPTAELAEIWNNEARALPRRLVPLAYEAALPGFAGAVVGAADLRWVDCVAPLLSELEQAGQVLFVHPGAAAPAAEPWWAAGVAYTGQMQDAFAAWVGGGAARWPRLKVVFAFLAGGAPFQIERLVRRGLDPQSPFAGNIWFDTSSYGDRAIDLSIQTFGAGKLVFGSDAPVDRIRDGLDTVERFGRALATQLLVTTPLTLLGAETERWAA